MAVQFGTEGRYSRWAALQAGPNVDVCPTYAFFLRDLHSKKKCMWPTSKKKVTQPTSNKKCSRPTAKNEMNAANISLFLEGYAAALNSLRSGDAEMAQVS